MRRVASNAISSFGREATIRMSRSVADILYPHMQEDTRQEQMAFGLGSRAKTSQGTHFLLKELILPEKADFSDRSAGGVCPTQEFQSYVYFRALQTGMSIVEFHTHPGAGVPRFSCVDEAHAKRNAEYICRKLPESVTLVMVVGNNLCLATNSVRVAL